MDNASAGITNIVNADIDSAAAIADTKLAAISTAGKIVGSAMTALACIPSGAGVIPNVNQIGGAIEVVFDGGSAAIQSSTQLWIVVPKAITITGAYAFSDVSTTTVVDIWKDTIANYPPTDADSITASAPITITAATNSSDTTLTGWTVAVAALSVLVFNIDSNTASKRLTVVLTYNRA